MKRTCSVLVLSLTSSLLVQCTGCGADHDEEPPPLCEPPTENLRDDCFITDEEIVGIGTREDLEPFCTSRCTKLRAGLRISGGLEGAKDLRVFRNVKDLGEFGGLAITNTQTLESLEGLEQLERAARLHIERNQNLRSLEGLENLRDVTEVRIEDNPRLRSLEGLDRLNPTYQGTPFEDEDITARITIRNNDALEELDGFPVLKEAATISIQGNDNLKRITGFPQLERTRLGLRILQNSRLETLAGAFPEVQVVPGLTIEGNPMLPQCDAMAFVERVENDPDRTTVEGNPQLACGE